jgi:hypothetical protein
MPASVERQRLPLPAVAPTGLLPKHDTTTRQQPYFSTSTPRQKATYPLIFRAAGLGSG